MSCRAAAAAPAAILLALHAGAARAQITPCAGQPIRSVSVVTLPVISAEGGPIPGFVRRIANGISWRTRPETVRRELRFEPGDPCDGARLVESARVLRSYPYIRDATIGVRTAPGDSMDVDVETRDEWALGLSVRLEPSGYRAFRGLRVTENNTFGRGMFSQLNYTYFGRHAGVVADVLERQLLGGRTDLEVVGGISNVGQVGEVVLRREFESEYDRVSWRAAIRYRDEPFNLAARSVGSLIQPLVSSGAEIAVLGRIGQRGGQLIAGLALSAERLFVTGDVQAADPANDSIAAAGVAGYFLERQRVAGSLILGARAVRFGTRSGLDAVNAPDDIRQGIEFRTIVGHTLLGGGNRQQDLFLLGDLYAGGSVGRGMLAFLRTRIEGRRLEPTGDWDGVIGAADLLLYFIPSERGTLFIGAQGAGGWNMHAPFQLLVASDRTMRGFGLANFPAGRRVVVQTEERYFLGTVLGVVDLGATAFVDVGQGWAGGAPFGEDSGLLVSAGGGIRLAFPSGSRFTTRLDLAFPVRGGGDPELRVLVGRQFGVTSAEPADVERSRLPISTVNLYTFQRY